MLQTALLPAAARLIHPATAKRTFVHTLAVLTALSFTSDVRAAEAPAQAWPSAVSGGGSTVGATRTFTWGVSPYGNPGVTATQTITSRVAAPSAAGCALMGGSGTASSLNSYPNVATFIEPDFPSNGLVANSCIERNNGYVSSFVLSKPLIAPIFHFYNLDASRFAITGMSTTGAAIGLQTIVKNNLMDVSGTTLNNTVQAATQNGCNDNSAADSVNGACGSFRVTAASGLIQSLTLNNNATPPYSGATGFNDGLAWSVSFPTAPLIKQFSPATITAGETSRLTFSISNPSQSGSVTLTPLDFTDNLPTGVTLASATAANNGSCGSPSVTNGSGGALAAGDISVRATNISVAPGATCTITINVTATEAGSYTNDTANMSSSVGNLVPSGSTTLTVGAPQEVDLSITKTDGTTTYTPGLDASYTIVVTNNGPADVTGAYISDPLPTGATSASWTCSSETSGAICGAASGAGAIDTTADLPAGGSVTYTFSMGVSASYSGMLTNTATVTAPDGVIDTDTSNNSASDTNTAAPPPVSGACSPVRVVGNTTFNAAPLPVTGAVTKSGAPRGWNATSPWSTLGGNYTFTWNFNQPVPANWIQFIVSDVGANSYQTTPVRFTITLGAGSTATLADFSFVPGWHSTFTDLNYSAGVMTYNPSGDIKQAGALQGNSTDTVTSITITTSNVDINDYIVNLLYVRPACLTLQKVSQDGTGSFPFNMTNVVQANGTAVPSTTLTTTTAGTAVSTPVYNARPGTGISLSEVVPDGWSAASAVCTDQNAGSTGNPTVIGSFATPTLAIPAANVRPQSDIQCLFTNTPGEPEVSVKKELIGESITTNNVAEPGEVLTYRVTITHTGGGVFKDFDFIENVPNGATMTRVSGANGFTDPVAGASTVQLTVPEIPVGESVEVEIDLTVAAPIPLGVSQIRNLVSGGDVPADCAECSVTTPTPPYTPAFPPTVSCSTTGAYFNTAYNGAGGMKGSGFDDYWQVALTPTPVTGAPPANLTYGAATVATNPPAVYIRSPFGNANWISHNSTASHPTNANYDIFYRYQFNLDPAVDPNSLDLKMSFYSDNSVYRVWVNGVAQNIRSNYGGADPYFYAGFTAAGAASGSMNSSWRTGSNEIIVHIKSGPGAQAFMAQINSDAICQPKITLRKEVVNDNGGTATATDFILRATGQAPLTKVIQGPMADAAVTNASIPGGTYALSEDSRSDYVASPYSCSIDGGAAQTLTNNQLTLANGQNAICTITNDDQNPQLTIDKSGTLNDRDGDGLIDPGETITYTFKVTNTGNVTLTGVTAKDPLLDDAGISVSPGPQTLAPGGSTTFTATYTPTQADINAGQVSNTATGTGTPPGGGDPIESPPDTVVVPPDQTPGLTIEKSGALNDGDNDGLIDLGETITYTFRVTNTGNVTLTNVTVNDPLLTRAGLTVSPGPQTLDPGGTTTFTATYTPDQADIDAGRVENTATAAGTPPGGGTPIESPPDTAIVPPDQASGLKTEKTGTLNDQDNDGLLDPGETITYSFRVTNTGKVTMTNVTVKDPLLTRAGLSVTPGPQTLAPGASVTFTAEEYTPTQAEIDAGRVENTASSTGTPPSGPPLESPPDTVIVPPDQTPRLTIEKSGTLNDRDNDRLIDLGETITYTFRVTNAGNVTMDNVTVNDPLLVRAGLSVTPGPQTLEPGGTATFTAVYTPDQADIDAGRVENTATGIGTPPGGGTPIKSPPDTVVVPPEQAPALTLEKTGTLNDSDGDGLIDLGETITYSFRVRNTGTVTLDNVTVNDPLLVRAGLLVTPGPQTLAPGGSATFTAVYTPTQAEIDAGRVENTATGTGTPPDGGDPIESPPDTVVVPPDQGSSMTVEKTGALNDLDGDGLLDPGETINYSFLVTNTGKVTLTNVTVNDPLLVRAGLSVTPGPQTLEPGGSATFTAVYTPTQAEIDAGRVENTATGTGTPPSGPPVESPPDTVVVPPDQGSRLTIDKQGMLNDQDGDGLLDPGETITYTFRVTNAGNVTMANVTVNDPLLVRAGLSVTPGPQTLAPGASATFTATYTPTQAEIDAGRVENTATGTGTPPSGPPVESPPDTVVVPPDPASNLTIQKSGKLNDLDGDGLIDAGETIAYTFRVTNTGNVTMANVTVNDPLLARAGLSVTPGPQTLAPGGSATFTATYTPTQAEIDAGRVENTATGTGTPPSGPPVESPPDTVTVPPDQAARMTIDKQGTLNDLNGNNLLDLGETIDYAFVVTNTGAVTLTNVTVKDPKVTINEGPQTLAPGASFTFTASYTPTQADIDAGSVSNTATGIGTPPSGPPVESPPDTVVVPPVTPSSLKVEKSGTFNDNDGNGYASLGDTITYSFTVTNTGGQVVTDVMPVDAGPTFNGKPATATLSAFTPEGVTLEAHASQVFTATYALTQEDIDNAAGVPDGMENSATAKGNAGGNPVPSTTSTSKVTMPPAEPSDITIIKQAGLRQIKRGEKAPFTIKVTNHSSRNVGSVSVTDIIPSGFRYIDGSATIDGVAVAPVVAGQRVRFDNVALGPNAEVVIRLQMLALSSAEPGKHTNKATVNGLDGNPLAPEARADIEIMIEPVFDCGDIIGKVFDDLNRNGYQDKGEPGLPGVRIATVRGSLVTTDKHGRFHVACADLPDSRIGSNFIMKVDPRTLPAGYRLTTENPRVIRLTAGKMSTLNFGASIGRVVRLDLADAAFEPGTITLKQQWQKGIDQLITALESEPSTLRIGYGAAADAKLARQRIEALEEDITERWKSVRGRYELNIETRVEAGQ
ncbi:choice-of-anchor D domain-containing protein (plasmid) [Phyllobacteriaceae bacterium JZ32]